MDLKLVFLIVISAQLIVAAPKDAPSEDTLQDINEAPTDYVIKFKNFFMNEKFGNVTSEEELLSYIKKLVKWEEPEFIRKGFPYYQSGYDVKGQPAWVGEFGKYDLLKFFEEGFKAEDLEKYALKSYVRVVESLHHAAGYKAMIANAPTKVQAIIDFEGLEIRQLGSRQVIDLYIKIIGEFSGLINDLAEAVYVINADFVTRMLLEAVRPFMIKLQDKLKIYGTNKDEWMPVLLEVFGKDNLPEWYGGSKDHKPLRVYG